MDMMEPAIIYDCIMQQWSPQIGDPSVIGWVTVAAYAVTGYFCMTAARKERARDRRFWALLSIIMLFLAVNKQLDLQSALTAAGRCMSKMQGWYGQRRAVQLAFILALIASSVTIMLIALITLRHALRRIGIALLGFGLVLTFVAVRAVGFHDVDRLISTTIAGARVNWILELSGLILILANAVWACRASAPQGRPSREGPAMRHGHR